MSYKRPDIGGHASLLVSMQPDWEKIQSEAIDRLRFPMAVAVVVLHYCMTLSMDATGPMRVLYIVYQEGICRLAVPCFFIISGFLFFNNLQEWSWDEWRRKLKSRVRTLLFPYILWNIIALLAFWGYDNLHGNPISLFRQFQNYGGLRMFWSAHGGIPIGSSAFPVDGPLWFIRDLIYFVILTPFIYLFIRRTKVYGILAICVLFLIVRRAVPEGMVFFMIGAYLQLSKKNIIQLVWPHKWWLSLLAVLLLIATCVLQDHSEYWGRFIKFFFLICGIASAFCFASRDKDRKEVKLNQFLLLSSFFVFAAHDILILRKVACPIVAQAIPTDALWGNIIALFLTPTLAIVICLGIFFLLQKILPRTTGVLTGNRNTQKK